jgi:hypothetical protein
MNRKEEYQDERWKERAAQIRELDKHKCAMCGAEGVELQVHHLSYPPPPFHLWDAKDDELVTLCKKCHERVHRIKSRPRLMPDRRLIAEQSYVISTSGERMLSYPLYQEIMRRGYDGSPFTQQIIDWLREKSLCFVHLYPQCNYLREDGSDSEMVQSFRIAAELCERGGGHPVGEFDDYAEAEVAAIKCAFGIEDLPYLVGLPEGPREV